MHESPFKFQFEAFGTVLEIRVLDNVSPIMRKKLKTEIFDYTVYFDESLSRFKKDSIVSKISQKAGRYKVSTELVELLRIYEIFFELTDGSMNPLIGNTISDLGYDAIYTLKRKDTVQPTPSLKEILKILNDTEIEVTEKVVIDIGAIGKGYWVDKVSEILERHNIKNYIINGSGDIYYKTNQEGPESYLQVELENTGKVSIKNEAICGSGIDKRNWTVDQNDILHHVIDAKTSLPTSKIASTWVKVRSTNLPTTYADALATALFFVPPKILESKFEFEFLIIDSKIENKKILFSKNFNANI